MSFVDQLLAERQSSHAFAATSRSPGEKLLQCTCSLFVLNFLSNCIRHLSCSSMAVRPPDPSRWDLKRKWRQAKQNRVHPQQVCRAQPQFGPSELMAAAKTITSKLQVGWQTSLRLSHIAGVLFCNCVGLSPCIRVPRHAVLERCVPESFFHETAPYMACRCAGEGTNSDEQYPS